MSSIAILGAGSWGTALAMVLNDNQHQVTLWTRNSDQAQEINDHHTNQRYLKDTVLDSKIKATTDLKVALADADLVLFVVPTKATRSLAEQAKRFIPETCRTIVHASKGLEQETYKRVSVILDEVFEGSKDIVALSGPSHAEEVAVRDYTAVTVASESKKAAEWTQKTFHNDYFRVYSSDDLVGVELGGALKNIYALAAGGMDALDMGDNAKAALITRGLAEMTRLGQALGARPLTFQGLSGLGDLVVTTTSVHSRNWQAGQLFAQGLSLDQVLDKMDMIVEGIFTTRAACELAGQCGVEMPIANAIYAVIYEGMSPEKVGQVLMAREEKTEISGGFVND